MNKKVNKWRYFALPLTLFVGIILIWTIAAVLVDNIYVLPSVLSTAKEFILLFISGEFYLSLAFTLLRSVIAFVLSFCIAGALALLAQKSLWAEGIIRPIISILRALPTIAVVLLLLFWTNSQIAPVVVTMLVVLPTSYTNFKNALDGVDGELLEMCALYGVDKKEVFYRVKLPAVFPEISRAAGAGLSLNLKLMVAAEVLSQTAISIGFLLNTSKVYFETARMIGLVVFVVIIGLIIELIFEKIARRAEKRYL